MLPAHTYHVTLQRHLDAVLEKGLLARSLSGQKNFNHRGVSDSEVYLLANERAARAWSRNMKARTHQQTAIIKVAVPVLETIIDPESLTAWDWVEDPLPEAQLAMQLIKEYEDTLDYISDYSLVGIRGIVDALTPEQHRLFAAAAVSPPQSNLAMRIYPQERIEPHLLQLVDTDGVRSAA